MYSVASQMYLIMSPSLIVQIKYNCEIVKVTIFVFLLSLNYFSYYCFLSTRSEAFKYMQEQNMAWPAIPYGHVLIDKLKEDYK